MPSPVSESEAPASTLADPRATLVQRVASSATFQRSRRLRDFLVFICEQALQDPPREIREEEIAVHVFEKPLDFDPTTDTLVRVQASQLRKRLFQYFSSEGAAEPLVIELPKGAYRPAFRTREAVPLPLVPETDEAMPVESPRRRSRVPVAIAIVAVASLAWAAVLFVQNRALQRRLHGGERRPGVERLWRQMFGNGAPVRIILADTNLTFFQDLLHEQLALGHYQNGQFTAMIDSRIQDPALKGVAQRVINRQFTSASDASLVHRVSRLSTAQGFGTEIVHARRADTHMFKASHNAVLSGPRRANPWIELFEERLNFRSRFDETARLASFENVDPRPGEQPSYQAQWGRVTYCRVAYLPNLDATGSVLIVSGTDLPATDAGIEFITGERWIRRAREALAVRGDAPMPHFEVLLRANRIFESASDFDIVAYRLVAPAANHPWPAPAGGY
jgi:hypothetical protein